MFSSKGDNKKNMESASELALALVVKLLVAGGAELHAMAKCIDGRTTCME